MYQNKVTFIGFLGNHAEVRTNENRSFTTLSLATKSSYKKDGQYISHTEWHPCLIFGKLSEFAGTLKKGAHLQVQGELRSREGRARRIRHPNILTRDQWTALVGDPALSPHVRAVVNIAMLLGLRASEILGLRWEDVDLDRRVLKIRRSHVGQYVDDTKTEKSEQELPIHEDLARVLVAWSLEQEPVNGWLFGNLDTGRPFWRDSLQKRHLIPAGKRIGIPNLGWHDFRHTYRAMMNELNISLELQRTLMRHENIRTTLGYGGKTPADVGRPANAKVVEMLRRA